MDDEKIERQNPLDYSIWGILEARVNAKRHYSLESLKTLMKKMEKLSIEDVRAAIDAWPYRLKAIANTQKEADSNNFFFIENYI